MQRCQMIAWIDEHPEEAEQIFAAIEYLRGNGKLELWFRDGRLQDPRIQPTLRLTKCESGAYTPQ